MGPAPLAHVLRPLTETFNADKYPELLVGLGLSDDAAVYRLNGEQAIIQTADFFAPVVDDPYTFGAIAAANAMSDVYAMGGRVVLALNIAGFPDDLPLDIVQDVFRGGADKVAEVGAIIAGGHTVQDEEPKYGLSAIGFVHPDRIITKSHARVGDQLVLTKPLGIGIITTALRNGAASPQHIDAAVDVMMTVNEAAAEAMQAVGVHAATDITGYGLLGHGLEMAQNSGVGLRIRAADLPLLPGTREYAAAGHVPGGTSRNDEHVAPHIRDCVNLDETTRLILLDPQTSGGLLMAVAPDRTEALLAELEERGVTAWQIGEVVEGQDIEIV
ncbi:MAG: Selenide, water dikinase [Anaerolineales bacterium]|nr:Selenide, water dikinase [Anaerolineales bacterium]